MSSLPQDTPLGKAVYIYTLSSPADPKNVRYVGKTIRPKARLAQHINDKRTTHRGNWLALLRSKGLRPLMTIIEETTLDKWKEREVFWVAFYRKNGFNLVNSTEGGDGTELSPEARAKISAAAKGRKRGPLSEERKRIIGDGSRGKKQSPEHVAKRTSKRIGSKHTPETIAKLSAQRKGKTLSAEVKAKLAAIQSTPEMRERNAVAHRGRKASAETRAKQAAANRTRQVSVETREKLAAINRGHEVSPATRAKIAAANKGRIPHNKGMPMSEEQKAILSRANLGKKASPESSAKKSAAMRGRKQSPEQVAARVAARKRTLAAKAASRPPTLWD